MRRIGTLKNETFAQRFSDYLLTLSIESNVDPESNEAEAAWNIWIRDERHVDQAREEFAAFEKSPEDSKYAVTDHASRIRDKKIAEHQARLKQQRELVRSMPNDRGAAGGFGPMLGATGRQQRIPITIALILISIVASLSSNFAKPRSSRDPGRITLEERTYLGLSFVDRNEYYENNQDSFASIRKGEVWRFVTPMLLHGDPFHLAFNMMIVFFLGSVIERLHGSMFLLMLLVGTHVAGMLLQVALPTEDFIPETLRGTPFAVGASGAVYGLFGFLWARPAAEPSYPIRLAPINVVLMFGWLFACMTPLIQGVANGAHLGGLFAGVFVAFVWRSLPQ
jgi:GlpG protein